jgi:predicted Zn-ribbon and HTH transcriptional regulator
MELSDRGEEIYNRIDEQGIKDIIDTNLEDYVLEDLKKLAKIESDKTVSLLKAISAFGDAGFEFSQKVFWEPMTLPQCIECKYWCSNVHSWRLAGAGPCYCGGKIHCARPIRDQAVFKGWRMSNRLKKNIEAGPIDWKEFNRMFE